MAYLAARRDSMQDIRLAINLDGVGYRGHASGLSFYDCPQPEEKLSREIMGRYPGIKEMPQWQQGDHMIFVASQVPALALTTTAFEELEAHFAHTAKDLPGLVDTSLLADAALFLRDVLREL